MCSIYVRFALLLLTLCLLKPPPREFLICMAQFLLSLTGPRICIHIKDKHPAMRGKIFSLDLGNVPTWLYRGGRMTRFQGISTGLSFIGFTAYIAPPNLLPPASLSTFSSLSFQPRNCACFRYFSCFSFRSDCDSDTEIRISAGRLPI